MTIEAAVSEWKSKRRSMGCVAAAAWFCKRVPGFKPVRLTRYTPAGEVFEHVVCTDGVCQVDIAPYNDHSR
jgi:hypothetical protein